MSPYRTPASAHARPSGVPLLCRLHVHRWRTTSTKRTSIRFCELCNEVLHMGASWPCDAWADAMMVAALRVFGGSKKKH